MAIYQGSKKISNNYNIDASVYSLPIGSIIPFSGSVIPVGFLLCDGQAVSKTTYADLYKIVGNLYGESGSEDTFLLPNAKGRVLQGADGNLGTYIAESLPNITGKFYHDTNVTNNTLEGAFSYTGGSSLNLANSTTATSGYVEFDASKSNPIYSGEHVQQNGIAVTYIIKALKVSDKYEEEVGVLIDDSSIATNKVWSSQKVNEGFIKIHQKNTSVTTAVYQWFVARYDSQTKQVSTTIPITIADDVSNVSLNLGDNGVLLHTGSGEVEQFPTQISVIGIEDSKSLGLLRFDIKVDSGDTSINCIGIPSGTTITFS